METEAKKERTRLVFRNLNKIAIPKRLPGGGIQPHLWYIVYEDNLLKPKILNKSFKSKVFAETYIEANLWDKPTHILYGKYLVNMGINELHKSYRDLTGGYHEDTKSRGISYNFTTELSPQRRKSLRTLYRRNLRRVLIKIMKRGHKGSIFFNR